MNLEMKNLYVETKDHKQILKDFSLLIKEGEVHAIMGPNGTGKSTLSKVLLGSGAYLVTEGNILVDESDILHLSTDERARLGIFLAMQNPTSIEGVSNSEFLKTALTSITSEKVGIYPFMKLMEKSIQELKMDPSMMHRSINQDFSGGERKKNEILQMKILKPKVLILDELDSGLDVDSLRIVAENINQYKKENPNVSILMITHYPRILSLIKPDYVHMMVSGKIIRTGDSSFALEIEKNGYEGFKHIGEIEHHE